MIIPRRVKPEKLCSNYKEQQTNYKGISNDSYVAMISDLIRKSNNNATYTKVAIKSFSLIYIMSAKNYKSTLFAY